MAITYASPAESMNRAAQLLELADEYLEACRAMPALFRRVLETYPAGVERGEAVTAHRKGRERCEAARVALLKFAARSDADELAFEVG